MFVETRLKIQIDSSSWPRPFVAKVESATKCQKEKGDAELAANVRQADLKQLLARLDADFKVLDDLSGGDAETAKQTALDVKWIRDRQMNLNSSSI